MAAHIMYLFVCILERMQTSLTEKQTGMETPQGRMMPHWNGIQINYMMIKDGDSWLSIES